MLLELSHLFFCVIVLVRRVSFERKGVVRKLRLFFMIDICMPIVPVREIGCIRWHLLCWSSTFLSLSYLFLLRCNWERLECCLICGRCFHSMRIDYLMLLFYIKRILLLYNNRLLILRLVLFLVVSNHALWIRILDKSVSASCSPIAWNASSYSIISNWMLTVSWEAWSKSFKGDVCLIKASVVIFRRLAE